MDTKIREPEKAKTSFKPSYMFIIIATLLVSAAVGLYNVSDWSNVWHDLTNGMPVRGELGFGKFQIYGVTYSFEYPFRLYNRTFLSAALPWLLYIPHQSLQFYLLTKARQAHSNGLLPWSSIRKDGWNPYAWRMLQVNVAFSLLHVWQSRYSYDGISATFPEISTLFAGVTSLIMPFMFEFRRRGIVFTWTPSSWNSGVGQFANFVAKYHGYLASFGITLTFWYHTFECTLSHMTGFFHVFLLLWQSSMLYHTEHRNRWWNAVGLEMWIIIHACCVSYFQGVMDGILFKMFSTSFLLLFLGSTFWGLPPVAAYLNGSDQLEGTKVLTKDQASKRRWRFLSLLIPIIVVYSGIVALVYKGQYLYSPMILGLPTLYYFFVTWYYMFFALGRKINDSSWGKSNQKSRRLQYVLFGVGGMSLASIMFIAEFIYRCFIPYSRHP